MFARTRRYSDMSVGVSSRVWLLSRLETSDPGALSRYVYSRCIWVYCAPSISAASAAIA